MPGAVQNVGKLEGWNVERLGGREAGRERWKKVASGPSAALGTSEWLVANGKQSAAETPRKHVWLLRRGRTTLKGWSSRRKQSGRTNRESQAGGGGERGTATSAAKAAGCVPLLWHGLNRALQRKEWRREGGEGTASGLPDESSRDAHIAKDLSYMAGK
jgi:hypothetical protein